MHLMEKESKGCLLEGKLIKENSIYLREREREVFIRERGSY